MTWQVPSADLGTEIYYVLKAKTSDGLIYWQGATKDRDDFDELLHCIALGVVDHHVSKLIFPYYDPALLELPVLYAVDTVTYKTTTGAGTYAIPADWSSTNNIQGLGSGAGGAQSRGAYYSYQPGGGGGGGAYAKTNNITGLSGTRDFWVGAGGAFNAAGAATWFKNNSGTKIMEAVGGNLGGIVTAGTGGAAASSTGDVKYSGGNGGTGWNGLPTEAASRVAGAGGGSAGTSGNGSAAVHPTPQTGGYSANSSVNNAGAAGSGSFGGGYNPGAGGRQADRYWIDAETISGNRHGLAGNNYGGGGPGEAFAGSWGGGPDGAAGAQGILVITYTPAVASTYGFNHAIF